MDSHSDKFSHCHFPYTFLTGSCRCTNRARRKVHKDPALSKQRKSKNNLRIHELLSLWFIFYSTQMSQIHTQIIFHPHTKERRGRTVAAVFEGHNKKSHILHRNGVRLGKWQMVLYHTGVTPKGTMKNGSQAVTCAVSIHSPPSLLSRRKWPYLSDLELRLLLPPGVAMHQYCPCPW